MSKSKIASSAETMLPRFSASLYVGSTTVTWRVATAGLGFGYARADSNAAAFAAAGACSGSGRPGCAGQVPVDLVDAGLTSGRSTSYWLEVAGVYPTATVLVVSLPRTRTSPRAGRGRCRSCVLSSSVFSDPR